ncbi:MAG: HNH endonuclease [Burkholderiales bacterium]|nr:HNH endonuclease [Burkholderiales bacterium]
MEPTEVEVDEALKILGMQRGACVCAYCGDKKSEWDHFRAVVKHRTPTGYITEIANLVPSCGKCNQSRGNKDWKSWMLGKARHSPSSRGLTDIQERIARLEAYEAWGKPVKIDYKALAGENGWQQHLAHLEEVLALLEKAETHASALRLKAKAFARVPK